jgi:hypothetical protein
MSNLPAGEIAICGAGQFEKDTAPLRNLCKGGDRHLPVLGSAAVVLLRLGKAALEGTGRTDNSSISSALTAALRVLNLFRISPRLASVGIRLASESKGRLK